MESTNPDNQNLAESILAKAQRTQRMLSPWGHQMAQNRTAIRPTLLLGNIQRTLNRITPVRFAKRSTNLTRLTRFTHTLVNRFPDKTGKYEPKPLNPPWQKGDSLVFVGASEIEPPQNDNWLATMPSFEQVRQSIETGRPGISQPASVQASRSTPTVPQTKPPRQTESWLERMPSFEELNRAVQAARGQKPSPVKPTSTPSESPTQPPPVQRAMPSHQIMQARARRVISRTEEVGSRPTVSPQPADESETPQPITDDPPQAEPIQLPDSDLPSTEPVEKKEATTPEIPPPVQRQTNREASAKAPSMPVTPSSFEKPTNLPVSNEEDSHDKSDDLPADTTQTRQSEPSAHQPQPVEPKSPPAASTETSTIQQQPKKSPPDLTDSPATADNTTTSDTLEPPKHDQAASPAEALSAPDLTETSTIQRQPETDRPDFIDLPAVAGDTTISDTRELPFADVPSTPESTGPLAIQPHPETDTPDLTDSPAMADDTTIPDTLELPFADVPSTPESTETSITQRQLEADTSAMIDDATISNTPELPLASMPSRPESTRPSTTQQQPEMDVPDLTGSPAVVDDITIPEAETPDLTSSDTNLSSDAPTSQVAETGQLPATLVQRQPSVESDSPEAASSQPESLPEIDLGTQIVAKAEASAKLPIFKPKDTVHPSVSPEQQQIPGEDRLMPKPSTLPTLPGRPSVARDSKPPRLGGAELPLVPPKRIEIIKTDTNSSQTPSLSADTVQRQVDTPSSPAISAASSPPDTIQRLVEEQPAVVKPEESKAGGNKQDLDRLARQVYPFVKRMLAVERERRSR